MAVRCVIMQLIRAFCPSYSKFMEAEIMKQLNIGIIGAGRIGKVHMESITYNVPTARVLGITDVFKDALPGLAEKYGIPKIYNDYKEMLADEEIDAVLVCSSTDTHADISIELHRLRMYMQDRGLL